MNDRNLRVWMGVVVLGCLTGCHDPWKEDVCMNIAPECPAVQAGEQISAENPGERTCHWLDSFRYLEVPVAEMPPMVVSVGEMSDDISEGIMGAGDAGKRRSGDEISEEKERSRGRLQAVGRAAMVSGGGVAGDSEDCVDINVADVNGLLRLPGVGAGKAKSIVAAREKRPFKRKKDITRIKGIGPKSYQRMAGMICDIGK